MDGEKWASPVALVLPGRRYTPDHPLLWFAAAVARDLGWQVEALSWGSVDVTDDDVLAIGRAAIERLPQGSVVIAKSLGTVLMPDATAAGVPGIWLTPLFDRAALRGAMASTTPMLLVGGLADESWDSAAAHASGHEVVELPGGDHLLEVEGDAVASVNFLATLTDHMRTFLGGRAPT